MFGHIPVPLDGSLLAEKVLPHAVTLARSFDSRVTLFRAVAHDAVDGESIVDPLSWQMIRSQAQAYLDDVSGRLEGVGLQAEAVVWEGAAAERISGALRDRPYCVGHHELVCRACPFGDIPGAGM